MADSVLSRPGADLAYEIAGDGPILGYSHGIFFSRAAEDEVGLLDWSPITSKHRLVRYDARAHGRSTGSPDSEQYRWPSLADDLIALADEVRGGEPVDWAGESMGTGTLLWAATKAPDRFHRLILMIPPTTGPTRVAAATMYSSGADQVERDGKAAWVAGLQQVPVPEIFADVPDYRYDADVPEPLLPSLLRGAAAADLPPAEAIAALPHRTLILAWETDPIHPVSTAEFLVRTLPEAYLHVSSTSAGVRTWPERIAAFLEE
ncbi:alpha/beta hydrolase [Actinoplanes sp. NPDC026619]|uniref:alpha/beta fold hydrolase n=1 Tax=Actinoplanes sp. NPDC026619 TaxID=3155798 RepID=UPI0033EE657A